MEQREGFKPIPGMPNYVINRDGVVYSKRKRMTLSPPCKAFLYPYYGLYVGGKQRTFALHRLLLKTFVGDPPSPKHECRHLDGNPLNNHLDNLRWGTHKENMEDRARHGKGRKIKDDEIRDIFQSKELYRVIAARYGIAPGMVAAIKSGKIYKHLGLSYKDGVKRGRTTRLDGQPNPVCKLSDEQILRIFQMEGRLLDIAKAFGIDISTVSYIKSGKRHAKITKFNTRERDKKMEIKRKVYPKIIREMMAHGITITDLAKATGENQPFTRGILYGMPPSPRKSRAADKIKLAVAKALNRSVAELFEKEGA